MAEPASQRSLKRVWIVVLVIIVAVWIIYALAGGPQRRPAKLRPTALSGSSRRLAG